MPEGDLQCTLEEFNDEGLYEAVRVYYAMEDSEVLAAFAEGN